MSKNKYQSLANAQKSKEQEKPESPNPQPIAQPSSEKQALKAKSPVKLILILFSIPILLIALSELFRKGCM